MRRRVLGVLVVAAFLALPTATPAQAANRCPTGYLCLYKGLDFRGDMVKIKRSGYNEKIYLWMNDKASSVKNKSGRDVILYADFESGDAICLQPGEKESDLSTTTPDMNDTISSSKTLEPGVNCL